MPTEKLYYTDPYMTEFTAVVQTCDPARTGWAVVLDRSAFYPEGGGQPGDTGTLNGVAVLDTHERDGEVVHCCAAPLAVGETVTGRIDWDRRFDRMQQHSAEHIVSGLICARFGCDNVGFHLGAETVVIDFNAAMDWPQLLDIEAAANAAIWENRPFLVSWPAPAELEALEYRSKKALTGAVRIVECPGADRCACCGTHVRAAGELGLIKLLSVKPFREGVRIEMVAGRRAYGYISDVVGQNDRISTLLSAKVGETAAAVQRMQTELAGVKYRLVGAENRLFSRLAEDLAGTGDVLLFEDGLEPDGLRRCAVAVAERCGGRCAVFSGADGAGYKYALAHTAGDLRDLAGRLNAALEGRGGGQPGLVQGAVAAHRAAVEAFFREN